MSKEILINNAVKDLDKNYNYKVDKEGNLFREKYNLLFDPYTLVTICIIIMGFLYYISILNNPFAVKNIDSTCENIGEICSKYIPMKEKWISEHPGEKLDVRGILKQESSTQLNESLFNQSFSNG